MISGCQSPSNKTNNFTAIKFELKDDSTKIVLKGLENNILESLRTDSLNMQAWQNLFAVYQGVDDGEQLTGAISGSYTITSDNNIIFSPGSSFKKGQIYCARFYYPQYYPALRYKSLPGKVDVKEQFFVF